MSNEYLKRVLSRNDRFICSKLGIYSIYHLNFILFEFKEDIIYSEYIDYMIENCKNPYQLSKIFLEYMQESENYEDKNSFINKRLSIKRGDFIRYSDKNFIKDIDKNWIDEDSIHLDVMSEIMTEEFGIEISINDCIEHILTHKRFKFKNIFTQKIEILNKNFKDYFGFYLQKYYAEHLIKICEFTKNYDETKLPF